MTPKREKTADEPSRKIARMPKRQAWVITEAINQAWHGVENKHAASSRDRRFATIVELEQLVTRDERLRSALFEPLTFLVCEAAVRRPYGDYISFLDGLRQAIDEAIAQHYRQELEEAPAG
jgi:hypothetical protein